jgi:hypothetical protein
VLPCGSLFPFQKDDLWANESEGAVIAGKTFFPTTVTSTSKSTVLSRNAGRRPRLRLRPVGWPNRKIRTIFPDRPMWSGSGNGESATPATVVKGGNGNNRYKITQRKKSRKNNPVRHSCPAMRYKMTVARNSLFLWV